MVYGLVVSISFGTLLFSVSAFSAPKKVGDLFPSVTNVDTAKVYPRSSPEYAAFLKCQKTANLAVDCPAAGPARFFDLSSTEAVADSFDFMNRCIGMRGFLRYGKEKANGIPTGNKLELTSASPPTLECTGVAADEVAAVQLLLCYTRATGAYCSLATACFEGDSAKGLCTKDYPAEELLVTRSASASPTPGPPSPPPSFPPSPPPNACLINCAAMGNLSCSNQPTVCFTDTADACNYMGSTCTGGPFVYGPWINDPGGVCRCHTVEGVTLPSCDRTASHTPCTETLCERLPSIVCP